MHFELERSEKLKGLLAEGAVIGDGVLTLEQDLQPQEH